MEKLYIKYPFLSYKIDNSFMKKLKRYLVINYSCINIEKDSIYIFNSDNDSFIFIYNPSEFELSKLYYYYLYKYKLYGNNRTVYIFACIDKMERWISSLLNYGERILENRIKKKNSNILPFVLINNRIFYPNLNNEYYIRKRTIIETGRIRIYKDLIERFYRLLRKIKIELQDKEIKYLSDFSNQYMFPNRYLVYNYSKNKKKQFFNISIIVLIILFIIYMIIRQKNMGIELYSLLLSPIIVYYLYQILKDKKEYEKNMKIILYKNNIGSITTLLRRELIKKGYKELKNDYFVSNNKEYKMRTENDKELINIKNCINKNKIMIKHEINSNALEIINRDENSKIDIKIFNKIGKKN